MISCPSRELAPTRDAWTSQWVGCGWCSDPDKSFTRVPTSYEAPTKEETDPEAPTPPAGDDPAGTPSTPDGNPETQQRPDIPGQLDQIQVRRAPGMPSQGQQPVETRRY